MVLLALLLNRPRNYCISRYTVLERLRSSFPLLFDSLCTSYLPSCTCDMTPSSLLLSRTDRLFGTPIRDDRFRQ